MKKHYSYEGNRRGLPQRRSIRLKGYDYNRAGLYFITICCQNRICRFGHIENGQMILNEYGQIACDEWDQLPKRFPYFELDVFQIMPNHMHGIILLTEPVGATLAVAPNDVVAPNTPNDVVGQNGIDAIAANENDGIVQNAQCGAVVQNKQYYAIAQIRAGASPAPTAVGDIVGAYKSLVANGCLEIFKHNHMMAGFTPDNIPMMGKLWQRNYYEHIIRDEQSYQRIAEYIINNPAKWNADKFFKK